MNDRDKEIKSNSDTYEIYLGTFIDDAFTWYSIKKFKDPTQAYKEFKKYVNTQLKYTDEELQQVWDTGRLDIELRQGNKLLNWVGIYSREVKDLSKEEEKEVEKGEVKKKDKKDSVKDSGGDDFEAKKKIRNEVRQLAKKAEQTYSGIKFEHALTDWDFSRPIISLKFIVDSNFFKCKDKNYLNVKNDIEYSKTLRNELYDFAENKIGLKSIPNIKIDDIELRDNEVLIQIIITSLETGTQDSVKDSDPELFDYESGTKFRTSYPLYELLEDNKEFEAFVFESMYNFCKGNDEEVIYHYEPDELSSIYISKKPDDKYGWIDFSY